MSRIVAPIVCAVALLAGASAAPAAVHGQTGSGTREGTVCRRLAERATEVPGIRRRIRDQLEALEARIAAVADPDRRARVAARLQPRIDGLEQLDARLTEQVALAERRCSPRT